ncbi:hypothetical protein [Winogradskyella sp.]|uniref:hypothetical protein n=1 Tax=Winogradskyella sp. TaxID=1883156 RepID=UPI003BAB1B47
MNSSIRLGLICFGLLIINCTDKKKNKVISKDTTHYCINTVLKHDDSLGAIRNHACKRISLASTIEQYVNALNRLDFNACPENFHTAFKNHAKAWTKMGEFTTQYSNLRGEMHDLFDSIETTKDSLTFKPLLKAIWNTWADVEASKINNF